MECVSIIADVTMAWIDGILMVLGKVWTLKMMAEVYFYQNELDKDGQLQPSPDCLNYTALRDKKQNIWFGLGTKFYEPRSYEEN